MQCVARSAPHCNRLPNFKDELKSVYEVVVRMNKIAWQMSGSCVDRMADTLKRNTMPSETEHCER